MENQSNQTGPKWKKHDTDRNGSPYFNSCHWWDHSLNMNKRTVRSLFFFSSRDSSGYLKPGIFHGGTSLKVLALVVLLNYRRICWFSLFDKTKSEEHFIKPASRVLKNLSNLEVLDLKGTPISTYPNGTLKLKNLVQLGCHHYHFVSSIFFADTFGVRDSGIIGCLKILKKLSNIEVDDGSDTLSKPGKLTQLKRLGILQLRQDNIELCSSSEKMRHLTSLYTVSLGNTSIITSTISSASISQMWFSQPAWLDLSLSYLGQTSSAIFTIDYWSTKSPPRTTKSRGAWSSRIA